VQLLDLTLPTPEENLALDEALLITAEADGRAEFLRLWESPDYFVVLGKNCRVAQDVWLDRCRADGVPILRRISGGGTMLQGPGCLNFAVVLRYDRAPGLSSVQGSIAYVLQRARDAVAPLEPRVALAGTSDLAIGDRKICGSAQRRQRSHFLHHGSILHHFDLPMIDRYLKEPLRQPPYRAARNHLSFLQNLSGEPERLRDMLRRTWAATDTIQRWPEQLVLDLLASKYRQASWHLAR
jgi:lipoate-protein ligase A